MVYGSADQAQLKHITAHFVPLCDTPCHYDIIGKYLLYFVLCYAHVTFRLGLPAQLISWTASISQWDLEVAWRTMLATVEEFSA